MKKARRSARHILDRRTVLRGMLGGGLVTLALPTLEAMLNDHGDAHADGSPLPCRFMTWMFGNGCRLEHWVPSTQGVDYALTEELAPLAAVKSYCNVLTRVDNPVAGRRGHHDGMAGCFSGHPFVQLDPNGAPYASKFGGPSVDQLIADAIGGDNYLKSLALGVSKRHNTAQGPTLETMSHRGPDQPILAQRNPLVVHDMLFNSFTPTDDPERGLRADALDVVRNDAQRLKDRVSKSDRERIDAHLESLFQLKKQLLAIPPTCDAPAPPDDYDGPATSPEPLEEVNAAMVELVTFAFSCDLTRVISYMFTGASGGTQFHMLPPSEFPEHPDPKADYSAADHHSVSHMNLPYEQDFIHRSVVFSMQQFAVLLEALQATPEGDGNLLDHSCILMASDVTEGWAHSENNFPLIVAGHAGGSIQHVGHYQAADGQTLSNVLLACMQAVAPAAGFTEVGGTDGTYDGHTSTALSEILA